jgi:hypothetical protein
MFSGAGVCLAIDFAFKGYVVDHQGAWNGRSDAIDVSVVGGGLVAPPPEAYVAIGLLVLAFVLTVAGYIVSRLAADGD